MYINGRTIWGDECARWEPKDLAKRICKKFKYEKIEDVPITSIEIFGLVAVPVVVDELIDFLGRHVKAGRLQKLSIRFKRNDDMDNLSSHVFDVLADKCTNLT